MLDRRKELLSLDDLRKVMSPPMTRLCTEIMHQFDDLCRAWKATAAGGTHLD
jgi:hypothetical protein